MKLTKLSLAAIMLAGLSTSSFAADNLSDAFKNGKISGALQAYYFNKDNGTSDADILTGGIDLSYVTADFYGLSVGVTFQGTYSPWVDNDAETMFKGDMWGNGAQLSEGYLKYDNYGAFAKIGRQYISTPIVSGSGSRVTKESFEAYLAGYNGVEGLTVLGGYITRFQGRTDGHGDIGGFEKAGVSYGGLSGAFDGAYTILAAYQNEMFSVNGQYLLLQDVINSKVVNKSDVDVMYIDGTFKIPMDSMALAISAQYGASNEDEVTVHNSGNVMGTKVAFNMGGLYSHIAYTMNDDDEKTIAGLGNGADWSYAGGLIYGNDYGKGVDTAGVKVGYKMGEFGVAALYSDYAGTANYNTIGLEGKYDVGGALKGLNLLAQFDAKNDSDGPDQNQFRFKANYKF